MYRRIAILSFIVLLGLGKLGWVGYKSLDMRADGMEGERLGEFAEVAEQTRQDVKLKLDEFIRREQSRPYTDYQYYYVPETISSQKAQQMAVLRSPLGGAILNDFAYGNFQIEPDGTIITPYYIEGESQEQSDLLLDAREHVSNIEYNLLPALNGAADGFRLPERRLFEVVKKEEGVSFYDGAAEPEKKAAEPVSKGKRSRSQEYQIESFQADQQTEQVLTQQRRNIIDNRAYNIRPGSEVVKQQSFDMTANYSTSADGVVSSELKPMDKEAVYKKRASEVGEGEAKLAIKEDLGRSRLGIVLEDSDAKPAISYDRLQSAPIKELEEDKDEMVQIRIEPFAPVIVGGGDSEGSIFGGQVFMLRHVQIEEKHLLQGFKLDEAKLLEEVEDSARRFMREGMDFEVSKSQDTGAAYAAILNFGFGDLVLNLIEVDPDWIIKEITSQRNWYFTVVGIVTFAVMMGLLSLWLNASSQLKLAKKKDDFISAVSHELRTPLTSIRMYSEMLEKNWVSSEEKTQEYYKSMRQESERLSRLIENVLDFSRIQKGRKKYSFSAGDINRSVEEVVEMMRPYAAQNGFEISLDAGAIAEAAFDGDAVKQIVVNLIDNAVKYARDAKERTIAVRTRRQGEFVLIEVEDHGPGVAGLQKRKVFEEFYRSGSEATRETNGTGLGLALVKKFAEAHNGFVEIISAKPTGAIFRVGLAV